MRAIRIVAGLALLATAIPELGRYEGERELYRLNALRERPGGTRQIAIAARALRTYPGDWRPMVLAGSASLLDGDPRRALDEFSDAFRAGERPEIDYDIGLALLAMGNAGAADRAFMRASWINPAIAHQLQRRGLSRYAVRVSALELALRSGRLALRDIPPPPIGR